MTNPFQEKHDFETRQKESEKILNKYPDRIPIIVTKNASSTLKDIEKCKFLVPKDLTIAQFTVIVRKRISLNDKETLFLFINNKTLATGSSSISEIYEQSKHEDGFLYISYCNENVFG